MTDSPDFDYSQYRVLPLDKGPRIDLRDYAYEHPGGELAPEEHDTALPSEVDLDAAGLVATEIRDQGPEGSCTGQGEEGVRINADLVQKLPLKAYSRAFLYYESRKREGTQNADNGAQLRSGLQCLVDTGVPPEGDFPYIAGQFAVAPPAQAYADAPAGKVLQYAQLATVNNVWQVLGQQNQAVVVAMGWYTCFDNIGQAAIMPDYTTGTLRGYHAPFICGYKYLVNPVTNQQELYLHLHNSWGPGWGNNGHGWISARTFDAVVQERWVITPLVQPTPNPTPTPTPTPTPDPSQQTLKLQSEIAFVSMGRGLKAVGADLSGLIKQV